MNSYDIDGVIYFGDTLTGLTPLVGDVIITGRSYEEKPETETMLLMRGIINPVFYNPLKKPEKTRETSGVHKAQVLNALRRAGKIIQCHFEDDLVQLEVIKSHCPWLLVVFVDSYFVEK